MIIPYENFIGFVKKKVNSNRARNALIKNRAIMVIDEFKPNNTTYYERLRERLEKIIQNEYERRKKNANYLTNPVVYEETYNQAIHEEQEDNPQELDELQGFDDLKKQFKGEKK